MPSARNHHTMTGDPTRGIVSLSGGWDASPQSDLWEWDGVAWSDKTPTSTNPTARSRHRMVFDSWRDALVLFGGDDGVLKQDTWMRSADANREPAATFSVGLVAAGFSDNAIAGLRARAHCGGEYAPFMAGDVGATLFVWSPGFGGTGGPGQWLAVASNTAALNATQPYLPQPNNALLDWQALSANEARELLLERAQAYHFQCRPNGPSGAASREAAVAFDYMEVRVRYLAP